MKLKIDKEFEVDVDRIRSLSMRGNTITLEMSNARYEITDTSQEVTNEEKVEYPSDGVYKSLQRLLGLGLKYIFMTSPDKKIIATVNKPIRKDGGWLYDATDKDLQITNEVIPTIDSHATLIDIEQWIKWSEELK